MENIKIIILYSISLFLIHIIKKCSCQTNIYQEKYFTLLAYGTDNQLIQKFDLEYNYTTKFFNKHEEISNMLGIMKAEICRPQDMDLLNDESRNILFWNTANEQQYFISSLIYISVFPIWLNKQLERGNSYCFTLENVGWDKNVNGRICEPGYSCPDLIVLGTTQFAYRFNKKQTLNLEKYFRKYFNENGRPIQSMMNKYSFYDYHLENNWLAMPVIVDFRAFRFNTTTFDYCIKEGYNLEYPPPFGKNWGTNNEKWTWEKVVEYVKIISECTGKPSLRFYGSITEDAKFFISLCQSLDIPFIISDSDTNVKKCGLRGKENVKKLSILKELFQKKYFEDWLNEDEIKEWQENKYPETVDDQPTFHFSEKAYTLTNFTVNGMILDVLRNGDESGLRNSYYPGSSVFLGGSGLIITEKGKLHDEMFEYIEEFISDKNPFFIEINMAATPFETIPGKMCTTNDLSKKDLCSSLLQLNGTHPYYYMYNNNMNVIYLTHDFFGSDRGITIDTTNSLNSAVFNTIFQDDNYICGDTANLTEKTITISGETKLEVPINDNKTIILKPMMDTDDITNDNNKVLCSVYEDSLKKGKPMQFPFNTFSEINDFEVKSPISLLLAHLYYQHNTTNEGSLSDIINECCDIIDDAFLPDCNKQHDIIFEVGECMEKTQTMEINYKNCKITNATNIDKTVECSYIPYTNNKGIIFLIFTILLLLLELLFALLVIKNRHERCIYISGFSFLLSIIISSIFMDISVLFWIGKLNKYKCIMKIWTMIIGITGFISSYSIKSEIIISIYNNKNIAKINRKYKSYILYIFTGILQIVLLIIWTITQDAVIYKNRYINNVGSFPDRACSYGNEYILSMIFSVDIVLLAISILMAFRGRNIPSDFNDSKKVFISSLITIFLLTFCYVSVTSDVDSTKPYLIILGLIMITSLIINIIFIVSNLMILFNIDINPDVSIVVVNTQNDGKNASSEKYSKNSGNGKNTIPEKKQKNENNIIKKQII